MKRQEIDDRIVAITGCDVNRMDEKDRNWLRKHLEQAFHTAVMAALNEHKAAARAASVRTKFPGMPKDALAQILTKRATRKTVIEGAGNGAAVTALEGTLASPEPASKTLVLTGIGALLTADIAFTTKVQMQLLLEIGEIYECPFSKDDEDDVWLILKTAFGLRGTEKVSSYGRFIFTEAAKKQFRALLRRHGVRRAAQQAVAKIAGKQVAKYVSEKALMGLIPVANAAFGAWFNRRVTRAVGKWAKVKAKIRASTFASIDALNQSDRTAAIWILPLIFHVGTADDQLVDNTVTLYAQASNRLILTNQEIAEVEGLTDAEDFNLLFDSGMKNLVNDEVKRELLNIAVTTAAATQLYFSDVHHRSIERLSKSMGVAYCTDDLHKKIAYLRR